MAADRAKLYIMRQRSTAQPNNDKQEKKMGCVPNCTRLSVYFSAVHLLFLCAALILPLVVDIDKFFF